MIGSGVTIQVTNPRRAPRGSSSTTMPLKTPEPPAVDLHVCAQPDALAWVRFPKPAAARGKGLHRRLVHTVLLRVPPDGSIWLLRATGMPWSEAHLHAAAAVLGQAGSRGWPLQVLENQLAEAVCGPPVTIALPKLDGIDASQWDTRNAAVAHVVDAQAARAGDHNAHDLALALDALHRSITFDLDAAHRTFFDALDGEALEITRQQGADALTYNFLVSPAHRRNRVQFAKCFPIRRCGACASSNSTRSCGSSR